MKTCSSIIPKDISFDCKPLPHLETQSPVHEAMEKAAKEVVKKKEKVLLDRIRTHWPEFDFEEEIRNPSNRLRVAIVNDDEVYFLDDKRLVTFRNNYHHHIPKSIDGKFTFSFKLEYF